MEELTPITRREAFLAKASGQDVETPTPITREEVFLDEIAKGGGGSSGGGVLVVHDVDRTLDKTYAEIKAASNEGVVVLVDENSSILYLSGAYFDYGMYYASFFGSSLSQDYETDSENGYPARP